MGEKPFFFELLDLRENHPPPPEEVVAVGSSRVEARSVLRRSIWTGEASPEWEDDGWEVLMAAGGPDRR